MLPREPPPWRKRLNCRQSNKRKQPFDKWTFNLKGCGRCYREVLASERLLFQACPYYSLVVGFSEHSGPGDTLPSSCVKEGLIAPAAGSGQHSLQLSIPFGVCLSCRASSPKVHASEGPHVQWLIERAYKGLAIPIPFETRAMLAPELSMVWLRPSAGCITAQRLLLPTPVPIFLIPWIVTSINMLHHRDNSVTPLLWTSIPLSVKIRMITIMSIAELRLIWDHVWETPKRLAHDNYSINGNYYYCN